ncbi:hypothetical protein AB3X91_16305 [Paraburkholderia sp. BR14263]
MPVSEDLTINQQQSEQYGRITKVASFSQSGASDQLPLPPLHGAEL